MDNYEVNVLTRKGGWKKLPQEIVKDDNVKINNENLSIDVKDIDEKEISFSDKDNSNDNLFENFSDISSIIKELKKIEDEKGKLLNKLTKLEENFEMRKDKLDMKIDDIKNEYELYKKAINLIKSLKNI